MPTPTPDPPPAQSKKALPKQSFHYKLVVLLYRLFAVSALYLVLAGILSYAFVMGFYAIST